MPEVGLHPVETPAQNGAVYLAPKQVPDFRPVLSQPGAQEGGGYLGDPGQAEEGHLSAVGLPQEGRLPLHRLHAVRLRPGKGGHSGLGQNAPGLVPGLQGQEHIGAHQQPQLIVRIVFPKLVQGIRRIAFSLPVQLRAVGLGAAGPLGQEGQAVGHLFRHGQPVSGGGGLRRQDLVGRHSHRDKKHPVQSQEIHGRPGRLQMPHVGRVKCSAIDADLHSEYSLFLTVLLSGGIIPDAFCP